MYLRWNTSMYEGLDKIMLPLEKIWVPDLVVENRYLCTGLHRYIHYGEIRQGYHIEIFISLFCQM